VVGENVCSVSTYCKSLLLLCIEFEELLKTEHAEKERTEKNTRRKKKKFSVENFLNFLPCFLLCFVLISAARFSPCSPVLPLLNLLPIVSTMES
jgi:hypothetical protein